MVRLQKFLAECGVASRRAAESLIESGRVRVNGETARLGASVDPDTDRVSVDGEEIVPEKKVYILLNKPAGVVTTASDTHGRKTVLDCVSGVGARVFPVGRLDQDVEGALLMTNDGELAHRLAHPRYEVDKEYNAHVSGKVGPETAALMEKGVRLSDGMARPASVKVLSPGDRSGLLRIVMREGRKREVKRLCEAVGHPVRQLRRTAVAGVCVKGLNPGDWRYLAPNEVKRLRELVGLR